VGVNSTPFFAHKDLLRQHSEYFARVCNGKFTESYEGVISLPEFSETTFKMFLQWLYGQCAYSAMSAAKPIEDLLVGKDTGKETVTSEDGKTWVVKLVKVLVQDGSNEIDEGHAKDNAKHDQMANSNDDNIRGYRTYQLVVASLLDLYVLAEYCDIRSLRNDVMSAFDTLNLEFDYYPGFEIVPKAFDQLPESSTYCQYVIKKSANSYVPEAEEQTEEIEHLLRSCPPNFLIAVLKINAKRLSGNAGCDTELEHSLADVCNFHEHTDTEEEEICKKGRKENDIFIRNLLRTCMAAVLPDIELVSSGSV